VAVPTESEAAPTFVVEPRQPSREILPGIAMSAAGAEAAASSADIGHPESVSAAYPHVKLSWERDVCSLLRAKYRARAAEAAARRQRETDSSPAATGERRDVAASVARAPDSRAPAVDPPLLLCAVVGVPGSGKTTSAAVLAEMLGQPSRPPPGGGDGGGDDASSSSAEEVGCGTLLMPFDGYHIPLETLRTMGPDAVYRRGAPDTFDAAKLAATLHEIRYGTLPSLSIPGFDHARGDPEEGAHRFERDRHRIVIVEGLYLLHDRDGWESIRSYFDFTVYVDANIDVCMDRLKARNRCIPGYSPEEIDIRVDAVDRANALIVESSKARADLVVQSAAY
jgi:pantothenate kinase